MTELMPLGTGRNTLGSLCFCNRRMPFSKFPGLSVYQTRPLAKTWDVKKMFHIRDMQ